MSIEGWVDSSLSPRIRVSVPNRGELQVVVDTGFNGELVLPLRLLRRLGFERTGTIRVELADGSIVQTKVFLGSILWLDQEKKVTAYATGSQDALLGTRLLLGCIFTLDVENGKVRLEKNS
ncbi:MAG TPA: clan AA aspartic protease [Candidatus Fraserbacteria bacterium]|nr:clan AA aspartic protease [Candidatus Fraserbacteria bacterium]